MRRDTVIPGTWYFRLSTTDMRGNYCSWGKGNTLHAKVTLAQRSVSLLHPVNNIFSLTLNQHQPLAIFFSYNKSILITGQMITLGNLAGTQGVNDSMRCVGTRIALSRDPSRLSQTTSRPIESRGYAARGRVGEVGCLCETRARLVL